MSEQPNNPNDQDDQLENREDLDLSPPKTNIIQGHPLFATLISALFVVVGGVVMVAWKGGDRAATAFGLILMFGGPALRELMKWITEERRYARDRVTKHATLSAASHAGLVGEEVRAEIGKIESISVNNLTKVLQDKANEVRVLVEKECKDQDLANRISALIEKLPDCEPIPQPGASNERQASQTE